MGEAKRRKPPPVEPLTGADMTEADALNRFAELHAAGSVLGFALLAKMASTDPGGIHAEVFTYRLTPHETALLLTKALSKLHADMVALEEDDVDRDPCLSSE